MTYILRHEDRIRFESPSLVRSSGRIAREALAAGARAVTGLAGAAARIPAAIGNAFAAAYADPFQPRHPANDPSDPRNF